MISVRSNRCSKSVPMNITPFSLWPFPPPFTCTRPVTETGPTKCHFPVISRSPSTQSTPAPSPPPPSLRFPCD
ncbi:MAG: hypothetical protein ACREIU_06250 [Planctomycetota bacterium]